MDEELSSTLLEEVFNEVDSLEKPTQNSESTGSAGFLADVVASEIEWISKKKKCPEINKNEENSSSSDIIKRVESLIHEGLTDSSDDEENKYFEEARYNTCGKEVKKLIKQKTISDENDCLKINKPEDKTFSVNARLARDKLQKHLENLKSNGKETAVGNNEKKKIISKDNLLVDPVLNMRIINPLVSSTVLKEKMIGRVSISTSNIKNFLKSPNSKNVDWVTGGAVISKISKTSQKGNQYCVWNVTDLTGDIKIVTVFLFGSAYKDFWKVGVGTVVGILNPVIMEGSEKSEATLRVDNSYKILVMGTSKDYGICKSKKKNGENCFAVVNTAKCDFCIYHLKKEYTKASRRSDLIPPKVSGNVSDLRKKILGKNQVFGGKIFTGIRGKKSSKNIEKDQERLKALSETTPTITKSLTVIAQKNVLVNLNTSSVVTEKKVQETSEKRMIDLNVPITKKDRNAAKTYALNYVRKHGPIKKILEGREKRTPEQIETLKRKLETGAENEKSKKFKGKESDTAENDPQKRKLEQIGLTEKFFQLMTSEVKNKELLNTAERDKQEKYFNKLETREKIEDKMSSTFKVECNAVRCLKCNYKSFSASELCKKEKHPLKVVKAIKRFWKCGQCSARTVCLELVPLHSCKNCGSSKWEKTSMMPEKGPNLSIEPLSLRGMEEKFVGAAVKSANLNLLVPEDNS